MKVKYNEDSLEGEHMESNNEGQHQKLAHKVKKQGYNREGFNDPLSNMVDKTIKCVLEGDLAHLSTSGFFLPLYPAATKLSEDR